MTLVDDKTNEYIIRVNDENTFNQNIAAKLCRSIYILVRVNLHSEMIWGWLRQEHAGN